MGDQRVAVVTGGSAGLGRAIGQRLVEDGMLVIAADLVSPADGSDAAPIGWVQLDVTDAVAVAAVFDSLVDEHGRLDVLVNNAGIQRHGRLEDLAWTDWAAVIDVHLNGTFACLQAAGRHMLAAGRGAIVNISSVSARGAAGRAPYSAAKAAINALTATAGAEWAARGVRVNAVAPGYIDTGVFREAALAGVIDVDTIMARIPAGRLAQPAEIAEAVSFLASDRAAYFNGQTLHVDGGFLVDLGVPLLKRPSP